MHLHEKTLESEKIYEGKILTLERDKVLLENGNEAYREVIRHPGGVCVVPFTEDGGVVMVKQFRYPHKSVMLEIPAGKLEWGEAHEACGRRELLEETGFTAGKFTYAGSLIPTPAYDSEVIHMYIAEELCPAEQKLDDDEFLELEVIPFVHVIDMVMNNEIQDAKTQIALLKAFVRKMKNA